jgi:adenylate cyclase class 2
MEEYKLSSENNLEIEAKYEYMCGDIEVVIEKLVKTGYSVVGEYIERDTYYNHPCRDFSKTDEALRLRTRRGSDGTVSFLTYKGPREIIRENIKSRIELEIKISDPVSMDKILEKLGFKKVLSFSKKRIVLRRDHVEIDVDELFGVGSFIEIETRNTNLINEFYRAMNKCLRPVKKTYLEICLETGRCRDVWPR